MTRRIRINRVHLEEDTARLLHRNEGGEGFSLLDLNRAGMPLMEIVTEPDARSPAEAVAYLMKLRQILRYIGVSDADMEKGSFRCEPNLSLRPMGSEKFGSKVELKNLNSFRAALRGMEFEVERQGTILREGGRVESETRGWRDDIQETASQRSKEAGARLPLLPGARPAAARRFARVSDRATRRAAGAAGRAAGTIPVAVRALGVRSQPADGSTTARRFL